MDEARTINKIEVNLPQEKYILSKTPTRKNFSTGKR